MQIQRSLINVLEAFNQGAQRGLEDQRQQRIKDAELQNQYDIERENRETELEQEENAEEENALSQQRAVAQKYSPLKEQVVAQVGADYTGYTPVQIAQLRRELKTLRNNKPNRESFDTGRPEGGWHTGETDSEGLVTGQAKIWYDDGALYVGECSSGKPNGQGTVFLANGDTICGAFRDGQAEGNGARWWRDGSFFAGTFESGVRDQGSTLYSSDLISMGKFVNGDLSGWGAQIYNNDSLFEGQFKDGRRDGLGVHHFTDGDEVVGTFALGTPTNQHAFIRGDRGAESTDQNAEGNKITFNYDFGGKTFNTAWTAADNENDIANAESELNAVYRSLVKRLSVSQKAALKRDEIKWISSKDALSGQEKLDTIESRIKYLQEYNP
jgi:hypothetical protein